MKKLKLKPLELDKKTLAKLNEDQLQRVLGGQTNTSTDSGSCTAKNSCREGGSCTG